ncbi:MAG TPA: DUF488 domain-containing protein [Candidatus Nanoarchaeia archaeon]|nr:DUF488 domain-containing protein [Candidatus Nanoarchaeia archaeon]
MLYTKSIIKPKISGDGLRISIMSRHTLNDGVTPDPRISADSYEVWRKDLAPPAKLIGDYYKRGLPWTEYERRYLAFLQQADISSKVQELARDALVQDITLLCIEEDAAQCHRRLLAEECQRYQPQLQVEHKS